MLRPQRQTPPSLRLNNLLPQLSSLCGLWCAVRSLAFLTALLICSGFAVAQEDDDDEIPEFSAGLQLELGLAAQPEHFLAVRQVEQPRLTGEQAFDPRLNGPITARYTGLLLVQSSGKYRLHLHLDGQAKLTLKDTVVFDAQSSTPAWHVSQPLELEFGYHPITIDYVQTGKSPELGLYWSSPQFQLEPIAPRYWFHRTELAPDNSFQQGQLISRALRCAACHELPGEPEPLAAPSLQNLAANISRSWIIDQLTSEPESEGLALSEHSRRMPHFGLSELDATAIADYLLVASVTSPSAAPSPSDATKIPNDAKTIDAGKTLFATRGCFACHHWDGVGDHGLFGGGDLTAIAEKRPAHFFSTWLTQPSQINAAHRMPTFEFTAAEVTQLAAFLATQGDTAPAEAIPAPEASTPAAKPQTSADTLARGAELYAVHGCAQCHDTPTTGSEIPASEIPPSARLAAKISLDAGLIALQPGCTAGLEAHRNQIPSQQQAHDQHRPGFGLHATDRQQLLSYLKGVLPAAEVPATNPTADTPTTTVAADGKLSGEMLLAENNCTACHARGTGLGISKHFTDLLDAEPQLSRLIAQMSPPPLFEVGDKLHNHALAGAINRDTAPHRPWLSIRMPKFNLSSQQLDTLVDYLVAEDRIPETPAAQLDAAPEKSPTPPDPSTLLLAGPRLVTADGFGCTSCHQIGKVAPASVALAARGPDLSQLDNRLRESWYHRWVRNPARIVPRMEMPSVQIPIHGVLGESLDHQLSAVWQILNQPGFTPPPADALRVVRASNVAEHQQPPVVLTDAVRINNQPLIKPLMIGLPNRHNALINLETNNLVGWWIGDTARQRTQGKTWYWEPAGTLLVEPGSGENEVTLLRSGKTYAPQLHGQFLTEIDRIDHTPERGMQLQNRLHFHLAEQEKAEPDNTVVSVEQTFQPVSAPEAESASLSATGFDRTVRFTHVPEGAVVQLGINTPEKFTLSADRKTVEWTVLDQTNSISLPAAADVTFTSLAVKNATKLALQLMPATDGSCSVTLQYRTQLPVDRFEKLEPWLSMPSRELNAVPGFEAVQLPLPRRIMPTGFAWRDDGGMYITSLTGPVFLATDANDDGLHDTAAPFSDELAAPYGAVVRPDGSLDVINKFGLLRLTDTNSDGRADKLENIASGWGHTYDYHDWAVGLVEDQAGGYYVMLPCYQDTRTPAQAYLRGTGIRLIPQQPTREDPRRYKIQLENSGHRFPMGLAINRDGDLFSTDNQGNYKPFNELNHLLPGKHYGFFNRDQAQAKNLPKRTPPAVEIPHPWTRSVNGICFLETPPLYMAQHGKTAFGPFEDHMLGCEYDTRRVVRMSLQKVGDIYQGAAYPFSVEPTPGEDTFEGPIVCQVSPDGDVYIGNIRDSGWGAGQNTGSVVRLRLQPEQLPAGIAEVRATADGFEIDFTTPLDAARLANTKLYQIESYRRESTPAYGGADLDRRSEAVAAVEVSSDRSSVTVRLDQPLRAGFVYDFHLQQLATPGKNFYPAEAYYTLRVVPETDK